MFKDLMSRILKFDEKLSLVFILLISGLYILTFGYELFPDSTSYIDRSPVRTGGYPLIIGLFTLIGDVGLYLLAFVQVFLWIWVSLIFSNKLCEALDLNKTYGFVFWIILCLPLNPVNLFANAILTEAFSFILSLVILIYLFKLLSKFSFKNLSILFAVFVSVQFIRPQLSFYLFVFISLSILFLFLKEYRKSGLLLLIGVVGFISASTIDKTYHYFEHDFFGRIPFIGTQVIALPFDTISDEVIQFIPNEEDKELLMRMKELTWEIGVHRDQRHEGPMISYRGIHQYATAYNPLRKKAIHVAVNEAFPDLDKNGFDRKLTHLAIELLKVGLIHEPVKMIRGYISNIVHLGFGSWIWFIVSLGVLVGVCLKFLQNQTAPVFVASVISISHFVNIGLVSILEPVLYRYSFYTELPFMVLVLALCFTTIDQYFKKSAEG